MAKVFLRTCFAPFSPKQRPLSSPYSIRPDSGGDQAASVFISSIILDLNDLETSLEDGSVSLQWCRKAMILVRKMHSHILLTFKGLFNKCGSSDQAVNMMESYLQESLDLLDLCNLLKSSVSGFDKWVLMVIFAMKRTYGHGQLPLTEMVDKAGRERIDDVKRWMERSLCKLGDVATTKIKNCHKLTDTTEAIQSAITMICLLVFSSVIQPVPIKVDPQEVCHKIHELNSFSGSIQQLVSSFVERSRVVGENQRLLLSEIEMIDNAIADFQLQTEEEQMARDKQPVTSVENVRRRSLDLKEGLDLFESMVDEVFNDVIKGRKKVLRLITSNKLGLK